MRVITGALCKFTAIVLAAIHFGWAGVLIIMLYAIGTPFIWELVELDEDGNVIKDDTEE